MQLSPLRHLLIVLVLVLVLVLDPQLRRPTRTLAAPDARVPDDATPASSDVYDYN